MWQPAYIGALFLILCSTWAYSETPTQYHIQTDEGKERYFKYQTYNGQYRKEKRLSDGTVVGTFGWVDPTGTLLLYDYVADQGGYRILRTRKRKVPIPVVPPKKRPYKKPSYNKKPAPVAGAYPSPPRIVGSGPPLTTNEIPSHSAVSPVAVAVPAQNFRPAPSKLPPGVQGIPDRITVPRLPAGKRTVNYNLNNQFHYEVTTPNGIRVGRHGYVDPFHILRIFHYTAGPNGLSQRKEAQYVGAGFDTAVLA